ncbi:MAG: hypothetical protein MMC23_006456 [Stictis urceolatum]|nr:hypothetical protein [Stictis urceolata]
MGIQSVSKRWGDYEEQPFLDQNSSTFDIDLPALRMPRTKKQPLYLRWSFLFHVVLVALYTFVSVLIIQSNANQYSHGPGLVYTPAREAVSYEAKWFEVNVHKATKYFGEPSPEKENAWDELLSPTTVRISIEDMERFGRVDEGIPLPSGEYLGTVNVFHDLHCLRRISRLLYQDHYFPNITEEIRSKNLIHAREQLRLALWRLFEHNGHANGL